MPLGVGIVGALALWTPAAAGQTSGAAKAPDVVVHVADLPARALSEFSFKSDPASPGGKLADTPNSGDELDPPPENDPHVTFTAQVQRGVPYRCWIHMKVGTARGKSQANLFFVQMTGAVDASNKDILVPQSPDYLLARGPAKPGWSWVSCNRADSKPALISFKASGAVTVRLQAGMEGVGFDQFVLSPERFLDKPPSEAVVRKASK
jgi:hypothetical protein